MNYLVEDFIDASNSCANYDDALLLYRDTVKSFGFDQIIYTFVTDHTRIGQKAQHGIVCDFPQEWMTYYDQKNYIKLDPVILNLQKRNNLFSWSDVQEEPLSKTQKMIFDEASEFNLASGMVIPCHGPFSELAGVGLASSEKNIKLSKNDATKIEFITKQLHSIYCDNIEQKNAMRHSITLTPREREILEWWANGKTSDEISIILGCSQSNIKWHIKNIYAKLDANEKVMAVTKAIRLGLIFLNSFGIHA